MTTAINIHQQIAMQEDQVEHAQDELPKAVERGAISQEYADLRIATVKAILNTLLLIRAAGRGEVIDA